MPTSASFTLFPVRGIRVGVDWTWFLILGLLVFWLSGFYRDVLGAEQEELGPYLYALATAILFFGSILLHELGHAVVALRNGIGISHITLWIFGGVAGMQRDSGSPGVEFRVAVAGPLVTLAIVAACIGAGALAGGQEFWELSGLDEEASGSGALALLVWIANINALILVFNLIPAFPLDGGRIARAIAWRWTGDRRRATRLAAGLGQAFSWIFIGGGILIVLATGRLIGIWLALIGWIIGQGARSAVVQTEVQRRLGDLRVADVMDTEPVAIPEEMSVEQALDEYFLRYRWPWFPVVDAAQRFVGLLKRGAADAVPEVRRTAATVREVLERADADEHRVRDDAPLEDLLGNDELRRLGALAAVDSDGRLSGVITVGQLGRALRDAVGEPGAGGAQQGGRTG